MGENGRPSTRRLAGSGQGNASTVTRALLRNLSVSLAVGDTVYREGDPSNAFYLLLRGAVTIIKDGESIAVVSEPMSYFGEMTCLLGQERNETVTVREAADLIRIPSEKIEMVIDLAPSIGKKMLRSLTRRVEEMGAALAAAESKARSHRSQGLDEILSLAQFLKRVTTLLGLATRETGHPLLRDIHDYARESGLATRYATRAELDPRDLQRYDALRSLVEQERKRTESVRISTK